MESINLNNEIYIIDNDYIYDKLNKSEEQMKTTSKRYSKDELLEMMNNIFNANENHWNFLL